MWIGHPPISCTSTIFKLYVFLIYNYSVMRVHTLIVVPVHLDVLAAVLRVYDETGRRPNRPPIAGSGRLLFPTAGAAGGAQPVYTAAAVLYTHYTASTNYLPLMSSQFDWH